jgi:hypothetical protein
MRQANHNESPQFYADGSPQVVIDPCAFPEMDEYPSPLASPPSTMRNRTVRVNEILHTDPTEMLARFIAREFLGA